MQRPRRTSEFQDDPGGIKRQSRIQQRNTLAPSPSGGSGMVAACTTGTAKKHASRIAVPLRPSSNDRSTNAAYLAVPSSTKQRGVTPQKTPLPKNSANRVLFTAEKQRTSQALGCNSVALHNDKKWVQEQTQRITEHLLNQSSLAGGISTEFLNRGLRQMSIKQFVAIVNYFLAYIWGSRFAVGNDYVNDIINILQKLQYPHPINKSWLKTPNAQHSFGNVIVLLDFLMDFVPTNNEQEAGMYFELNDPKDLSAGRRNDDPFEIPNLEFQRELLRNSEKGFMLWDKQKNDEFSNLKQHTCDLLIQAKCGVTNMEAIEEEIGKLKDILKSLENEKPPEDKEMQKKKSKLSRELKNISSDIKTLQAEYDLNERDIKEMGLRKVDITNEVAAIEMEIISLQTKLSTQSCTVDQRDQMIAEVMQHKQMIGIKERTIQDLQNRYHNEQILQSKGLKHLNEQIEKFNRHIREIQFSDLKKINHNNALNDENILELSLRPQQTDLDRLTLQLMSINKRALDAIQENKQHTLKMRERCKQLQDDVDAKILPRLNALRTANSNNIENFIKFDNALKKDVLDLFTKIQEVEENLLTADKNVEELHSLIENKTRQLEEMVRVNENTMQNAEQKHHKCLEQKKAFLKAYEEMLEECFQSDRLLQLTQQIEMQEVQLEALKKEFEK